MEDIIYPVLLSIVGLTLSLLQYNDVIQSATLENAVWSCLLYSRVKNNHHSHLTSEPFCHLQGNITLIAYHPL